MKIFWKTSKIVGIVVLSIVLLVLIYLSYVFIQYYRIDDDTALHVNYADTMEACALDTEYSITTYNIGFGAYNQDYSFFMDKGTMIDGTEVQGTYSKAQSKDIVVTNTKGVIDTIDAQDADFSFFQEVDTDATRSYHVNQYEEIQDGFSDMASIYASNFHTAYFLYPFNDPMGYANAGIVTLSKYNVVSSNRYSFPLTGKIFTDITDLDRCYSLTRINVEGDKDLVLINVHMSAYDEGGKVRAEQLTVLAEMLELEKDNYVIVGGDFNQRLNNTEFETTQNKPEWVYDFDFSKLPEEYRGVSSTNVGTCRSTDMPYTMGENYTTVIDGFIVNDNVETVGITNIDVDYEYSDHNPVKLQFKLKNLS
ncbi:MAG: endonuclease/exonuclease/phosphatase family protein [Bacilli bacterium]